MLVKGEQEGPNAAFAKGILVRAAEVIRGSQEEGTQVIDALQQARDEFVEKETRRNKSSRNYHFDDLLKGLRKHLIDAEGADPESFLPIADWEQGKTPEDVATLLRNAVPDIARVAAQRVGAMSDKEKEEHTLLDQAAEYLRENGLEVKFTRDPEGPNAPLDYRGTVDGEPWAFELTKLRRDAEGWHRKLGHPNENNTIEQQLKDFEKPIKPVPQGPNLLRAALNKAVNHGMQKNKIEALKGDKYCLVIHNQQFLYIPDWEQVTWPETVGIDAIMICHDEEFSSDKGWEARPPDAFGKNVNSTTLEDLEQLVLERQNQDRE